MNNKNSKSLTYKDSGVDITAGDDLVQKIKPLAKKTLRDGVINGIGGFGALFEISKKYQEPVLQTRLRQLSQHTVRISCRI